MTREEHLAECKRRALEYVDRGDLASAIASMGSDLSKHPETPVNEHLMMVGMMHAIHRDRQSVRRWIEGFN